MRTHEIEPITADNHRPGMPMDGYLVRYSPHETYGWLCRKICASLGEAEAFAATLDASGMRTDYDRANKKAPTRANG